MRPATILSRLASTLLGAAALAFLFLAVGPHTGAYRTLTILSDSMAPTFDAGDMIVVRPAPTSSIRVGDVITYEAPVAGTPVVTHRVQEVVRRGAQPVIVTRGDANDAADPWRAKLSGDTIWRQVAVVPHAGSALRLLREDGIRHAMTWGLPALLLLMVLIDTWRPRRSDPRVVLPTQEDDWDLLDDRVSAAAAGESDDDLDGLYDIPLPMIGDARAAGTHDHSAHWRDAA